MQVFEFLYTLITQQGCTPYIYIGGGEPYELRCNQAAYRHKATVSFTQGTV